MIAGFRFATGGRKRLLLLERLLHAAYEAPESLLGNQPNVLDEAVYIILSFQTDLRRFRATWENFRTAFPRWDDADRASINEIAAVLRVGGLHQQKARAIKKLIRAVHSEFGEFSLDALRHMDDVTAERVLTRLPGLSWKGARCVLLYSLQRAVFPVDGNTFRILRRTGVIPHSSVYRRRSLHDALQAAVPADRRRPFHVNLVVHGQRRCLPGTPHCGSCSALAACRRRGLGALETPLREVDSQPGLAANRQSSKGRDPTPTRTRCPRDRGAARPRVPDVQRVPSGG